MKLLHSLVYAEEDIVAPFGHGFAQQNIDCSLGEFGGEGDAGEAGGGCGQTIKARADPFGAREKILDRTANDGGNRQPACKCKTIDLMLDDRRQSDRRAHCVYHVTNFRLDDGIGGTSGKQHQFAPINPMSQYEVDAWICCAFAASE
jgi:hypothetical protein